MADSWVHDAVLRKLRAIGVNLENGHFVYSEGWHGSAYVDHRAIFRNPKEIYWISAMLSEKICVSSSQIEVVIGPMNGGAFLAQWVAYHLSCMYGKNVIPLYASKTFSRDGFFFEPEFAKLIFGKRALVVDDVVNSGRSVLDVIYLVSAAGGALVGVGGIWNRGGNYPISQFNRRGVRNIKFLVDLELEAWDPNGAEGCHLCITGVPISQEHGHPELAAQIQIKG